MACRYRLLTLPLALLAAAACERRPAMGYLKIDAPPGDGTYEIYRIASESPLQFVSEESGRLGDDVALSPGNYLVLADCSSETVIIYPGQHTTLVAHRVEFTAPHKPDDKDSFSVQCSRSDKTKSRQLIANRYELNIIHGKRDLLVGMVPMHIDFTAQPDAVKPKILSYKLSGLQVADFEGNRQDISYFVSPVDELIAATKYQQFGHWEFLLPGHYMVEVNGTRMQVDLTEGQERVIKPALFNVVTSSEIDLEQPARVKGSPWLVEINTGHWLNFNETYPVLPGAATVSISGSTQSVEVQLVEGEKVELKARSVTVDSGCVRARGEASTCLGNHGVSLYLPEEPYPFMESVSDIPILFIDQDAPILVGVDGSRDITVEIPANIRDKTLSLGYAKLEPIAQYRPGHVTDLVRVDTMNAPFDGHTLDVNLERNTVMPLLVGSYRLDHFLTVTSGENGSRSNTSRNFIVEAGKTTELEFQTFFTEKKFSTLDHKSGPQHGADGQGGNANAYHYAPVLRLL